MKRSATSRATLREQAAPTGQHLKTPLIVSLTAHVVFFILCMVLPHFRPVPKPVSQVISVDLVGINSPLAGEGKKGPPKADPKPAAKADAPARAESPAPPKAEPPKAEPPKPEPVQPPKPEAVPVAKPQPAPVPVPKPPEKVPEPVPVKTPPPENAVSVAPKPVKEKESLKKQTYDAEKVVKSAVQKVANDVKAAEKDAAPPTTGASSTSSSQDQLKDAMDRMRKLAAIEGGAGGSGGQGKSGAGLGAEGKGRDAEGAGAGTADIASVYGGLVKPIIQRNWTFSDQLAGGQKGLYNLVAIKIARNGEIIDIRFDQKSGNAYFDESTLRAIKKSNPLPPLPADTKGPDLTIGFKFSPSGLQ